MIYPTTVPYPDPNDCIPERTPRLPAIVVSTHEELFHCEHALTHLHHRYQHPPIVTPRELVGMALEAALNNDAYCALLIREFADLLYTRYVVSHDQVHADHYEQISLALQGTYKTVREHLAHRCAQYRIEHGVWLLEDFVYPNFVFRQGEG